MSSDLFKWDSGKGENVVDGPASAVDGNLPVFDGTTGKLIKDSGSAPHAAVTLDAGAGAVLGLTGQQITLDAQAANRVLAGPASGAEAAPTFRALVASDMPERVVLLTTALTSTNWDGDARSTTAKTLIDLSAVFGVPAGIRGVIVFVAVRDSDSANTDCKLTLSPNNVAGDGIIFSPYPVNDRRFRGTAIVPCDANGDIYYQVDASGAGTFDAWITVTGYII